MVSSFPRRRSTRTLETPKTEVRSVSGLIPDIETFKETTHSILSRDNCRADAFVMRGTMQMRLRMEVLRALQTTAIYLAGQYKSLWATFLSGGNVSDGAIRNFNLSCCSDTVTVASLSSETIRLGNEGLCATDTFLRTTLSRNMIRGRRRGVLGDLRLIVRSARIFP